MKKLIMTFAAAVALMNASAQEHDEPTKVSQAEIRIEPQVMHADLEAKEASVPEQMQPQFKLPPDVEKKRKESEEVEYRRVKPATKIIPSENTSGN